MFERLKDWWDTKRALFQLGSMERYYSREDRVIFEVQITRATEAFQCGDYDLAVRIWHELRELFPRAIDEVEEVLRFLLEMRAFDELDNLMRKGLRRYRGNSHFAKGYTQSAHKRGDLEEAILRCEMARKRFPRLSEGYTIANICLNQLGRLDEADAVLRQGARKIPRDFELLVEYARHAARRRDWDAAIRRWKQLDKRFKHFVGPVGVAQCLREMGRFDEADQAATEATERFPETSWGFVELANIATARGDHRQAMERWSVVRDNFRDFYLGYTGGAESARRAGDPAGADDLLRLGTQRIPGNITVHQEYARDAERRGDWRAAAERWALARKRFPDDTEVVQLEAKALAVLNAAASTA